MKNPSIKYGIFGLLTVLAFYTLVYCINPKFHNNILFYWGGLLLYLPLMIRAVDEQTGVWNNQIDFKQALRTAFIVFLLCNLGYYFYYYGINLYDPSLLEEQAQMHINQMKEQLNSGTGNPQESNELREQIADLEKHGMQLDLTTIFLRMALGALGGFMVSAGIGWAKKTV